MPDLPFSLTLDVIAPGRMPLMWCLIAFIVTFLVTRLIVRYIRANAENTEPRRWWQPRNISVGDGGGLHLHHVVIGVILVLLSGLSMVTLAVDGSVGDFTAAAVFFGIGAALVLDECALILHLEDVYWSEDGRTSVDAVFVAVAIAGLLIMGFNPLAFIDIDIWSAGAAPWFRTAVIGSILISLGFALVVALKGKSWTAFVGMGIPLLLVVGAVRLARPHAPWARWRYTTRPKRMQKALEREHRIRRPLVRANLALQSALAGMPRLPDDDAVEAELDREIHVASPPAR